MNTNMLRWLIVTILALTTAALFFILPLPSPALAASPTFTVDSTSDGADAHPGDGTCAASTGYCTLRAAIMEANHTTGGGATVNIPGSLNHYLLTISPVAPDDESTGDLNITADMTIVGQPLSLRPVIIDANSLDGVIYINSGVTVSISKVTIENGKDGYDIGTGIHNAGTLSLSNSTVTANDSYYGTGGIVNDASGRLTLTNSTISNNVSEGNIDLGTSDDGGISNFGTMTITNSTITGNWSSFQIIGNSSFDDAGGVFNDKTMMITNSTITSNGSSFGAGGITNGGTLTLTESTVDQNVGSKSGGIYNFGTALVTNNTISENTSTLNGGGIFNIWKMTLMNNTISDNWAGNSAGESGNGDGGGIYNSGTLTFTNGTISGNNAHNSGSTDGDGAGIYNQSGTVALTNSTVSGNTALNNDSGSNLAVGGGIANYDGITTLTNVTLSDNNAADGGGIYQDSGYVTQTFILLNTIIANSTAGGNCFVLSGSSAQITSSGYNLSSDTTCTAYLNQTGDLNNKNPNLGPLQDNGGSTQTHALPSDSPAIDVIPSGTNGCGTTLTTDQRGVTRPNHAKCDIGAFEFEFQANVESLFLPFIIK